ncbi:MAG: bifunctional 5,10-methylenetetrahydrofolate dehydrogenase/5,10-methenyltetrahydrofolate cyclohydrolase [Syntrophomonas sp.]|nr:bifunctional 5,10-methylenetetrahydrofolate dehydrogenase/5,10-methenyltetrahydrofolate cyclohydrolase [Syntrophomonas sp.]
MEIISGKDIADEIKAVLKESNGKQGLYPCLAMLDVGDNQENSLYIGLKQKAIESIGGKARIIKLSGDIKPNGLLEQIKILNEDEEVDGILLQLPLPEILEPLREKFLRAIAPHKDVDGFNPENRGGLLGGEPVFISCAALACMNICQRFKTPLAGKKVLLIGESFDVIQPLALMFINEQCDVTIIPEYDPEAMQNMDIAIIEKGTPLAVNNQGVKPGALLIDAGFHWFQNRTCGNIDRDALTEVEGYLLPVPGGLGPLLIAHLLKNVSQAALSK